MTFNSDKTEIMLFSNTDIPEFNFAFNGTASSCKWSNLLEFPTPQLSHTSQAYSKIGLI
jgi:hypothetical protein